MILLHDLVTAEAAHDEAHFGERIGSLHARYGEIDGYAAKARASCLVNTRT